MRAVESLSRFASLVALSPRTARDRPEEDVMTKLGLGWSLLLVGAVAGCTTTVDVGTETGGGIQDPDGSAIVAPGEGGAGGGDASTTAGTGGGATSTGPGGAPPSSGSVVPGPEVACPDHARTILLYTQRGEHLRFDPVTATVTPVERPPCLASSPVMTRDGAQWAEHLGQIRRADPVTLDCTDLTRPSSSAAAFEFFSLASARDGDGSPDERLWIASVDMNGTGPSQLASVDMATGAVDVVGVIGDGNFLQLTMTGTADGRLIGFGQTTEPAEPGNSFNLFVFDIDRTDASIRWKTPMPIEQADPQPDATSAAAAFWGDALYVFFGNGTRDETWVVRHMLDGSAPDAVIATFDEFAVYGAASTPCDPLASL